MKKFYILFALVLAVYGLHAQCTIDASAQTSPGISPPPSNIPCVVIGSPYDQTIQVQCPAAFDTSINLLITNYTISMTVDSIVLDSVINLPIGLTWTKNPNALAGGQNGCLTFSGSCAAVPGIYQLTWYGTAWLTGPYGLIGSRSVTGSLNKYGFVNYYLNVISPGDSCTNAVNGISEVSAELNTAMSVSPNPSTGIFTLRLNAGSRVNGQVEVADMTGRTIFAQDVDLIGQQNISIDLSRYSKGIYTLMLRTADGYASRKITID